MKHIVKVTAAVIAAGVMTFGAVPFASAKTPPEVMTPYKAYRTALEDGNNPKASKAAYEAWKAAEKSLGDSKTTGDLAFNYADVNLDYKSGTLKTHKSRVKAFKRSIELAKFYGEDAAELEIDRRLKLAAHGIALSNIKRGKLVPEQNMSYFNGVKDALEKYDMKGSTYDADYNSLLAQYYQLRGEHEKALTYADTAIGLFESREDKLVSPYFYYVKLFKANILSGKGDTIPAALQYQTVMQNLEGDLDAEHPFIKKAFRGWMITRSELEDAGRLEEAEAAGLCECWPYENYKNKPMPLLRVPPIMPPRAKRSGYVDVVFDVDEKGKPYNIKSVFATEPVFIKSSLESVTKWRYSPITADAEFDPEAYKGVAAKITFRLTNSRGQLIPEKKL